MARKRRRRPFPWSLTWFVLLVVVGWTGLQYSPVTAARIVRVEGAHPKDRQRIEAAIQPLRGTPMLRSRPMEIQTRLGSPSYVRSVSMDQNIFGRVHVSMAYHIPIALFDEADGTCLAIDGTVFRPLDEPDPTLPVVQLPDPLRRPQVGFFANWSAASVAEVAQRSRVLMPDQKLRIEVEPRGVMTIAIDERTRVILGSGDDLDVKFDKLKTILQQDPSWLERSVEINLTAPNRPVMRDRSNS